jgi:hypothetical protein
MAIRTLSSDESGALMTIVDMALQEAALRLAWYVRAYGGIPDDQLVKLHQGASGLRRDLETIELLKEADSIRKYLLEICTSSPK